jgi:cytochrome P450
MTDPQAPNSTATERPTMPRALAERIASPKAWSDGAAMHALFAELRANHPLAVAEPDGFDPFWVATKHADILEISRQNSQFLSGARPAILAQQSAVAAMTAMAAAGAEPAHRSIVSMDAPEHPAFRAMTQAWFAPANVRKREEKIRAMARASVERMLATGGACDFVKDVALHYPLHVIMDILGAPEADEPLILRLTQEVFGSNDEDLAPDEVDQGTVSLGPDATFRRLNAYFAEIVEDRRRARTDDLASVLANARLGDAPVPELELLSYFVTVATAGHDTTSSSTAGALQQLAQDPALLARVKADPALIPGLVDEAVRWTTPVQHFMRTAVEDYELRGHTIGAGDWVMLCYPSGKRDEEVFDDPSSFRIDRSPNRHLAFGYGAHLCLGQHLAKLEMRILFEELLPRIASLELAGEPRRTEAVFVGGLKTLPVRFTAQ